MLKPSSRSVRVCTNERHNRHEVGAQASAGRHYKDWYRQRISQFYLQPRLLVSVHVAQRTTVHGAFFRAVLSLNTSAHAIRWSTFKAWDHRSNSLAIENYHKLQHSVFTGNAFLDFRRVFQSKSEDAHRLCLNFVPNSANKKSVPAQNAREDWVNLLVYAESPMHAIDAGGCAHCTEALQPERREKEKLSSAFGLSKHVITKLEGVEYERWRTMLEVMSDKYELTWITKLYRIWWLVLRHVVLLLPLVVDYSHVSPFLYLHFLPSIF